MSREDGIHIHAAALYAVAEQLFGLVAEDRVSWIELNSSEAGLDEAALPYLYRLDNALNAARAVFNAIEQPDLPL